MPNGRQQNAQVCRYRTPQICDLESYFNPQGRPDLGMAMFAVVTAQWVRMLRIKSECLGERLELWSHPHCGLGREKSGGVMFAQQGGPGRDC